MGISLPDKPGRFDILQKLVKKNRNPLGPDVDLENIANLAENFTGADLSSLVQEACGFAVQEYFLNNEIMRGTSSFENNTNNNGCYISQNHFCKAVRKVRPSVSQADLEKYRQ